MQLESEYKTALAYIQSSNSSAKPLSNEAKLQFYALFKQITTGKNTSKSPSRLKLIERAKWDAWNKLGNMNKEDAMKQYVNELTKTDSEWKEKSKKANTAQIRSKL